MFIVISRPEMPGPKLIDTEVNVMGRLLDQGLERLHLRKPAGRLTDLTMLVQGLNLRYKNRLVIHPPKKVFEKPGFVKGFQTLCNWMEAEGLTNLHIPAWLRSIPAYHQGLMHKAMQEAGLSGSTSIHFAHELHIIKSTVKPSNDPGLTTTTTTTTQMNCTYSYVLVSPLFESISKPGYKANTALWHLPAQRKYQGYGNCPLIGMGGIDAKNSHEVTRAGFDGVALLGAIWPGLDPVSKDYWPAEVMDNYNKFKITHA